MTRRRNNKFQDGILERKMRQKSGRNPHQSRHGTETERDADTHLDYHCCRGRPVGIPINPDTGLKPWVLEPSLAQSPVEVGIPINPDTGLKRMYMAGGVDRGAVQ